jgi:hypothetical protein
MEARGKKNGKSKTRCGCRNCAVCQDEARWERIFQEKFADKSYYQQNQARGASPLADLGR